jgi:hypothetical protein
LTPDETFDLTALAVESDRSSASVRGTLATIIGGLWFFGSIGAIFLAYAMETGWKPADDPVWATAAIGGLLGGAFTTVRVRGMGLAPRKLVVGSEGLIFSERPRGNPIEVRRKDPGWKITIYDRRNLSDTISDGSPRPFDFMLKVGFGPQEPIPPAAFDAILREIRAQGLRLTGNLSPPVWPPRINTLIVRPKGAK